MREVPLHSRRTFPGQVNAKKDEGNEAFKQGNHEEAVSLYSAALDLARTCEGAHGLDDDVLEQFHAHAFHEAFLLHGKAHAEVALASHVPLCGCVGAASDLRDEARLQGGRTAGEHG